MNPDTKQIAILWLCTLYCNICVSQVSLDEQIILNQNYAERPHYDERVGRIYNDPEYYSHPDFGTLTFSAPYGKNVVEDISKRTEYSRYYIDIDHPAYFYIEKSTKPLHLDINGDWVAIDPSLRQLNQDFYVSGKQHYETTLNLLQQSTEMKFSGDYISFNRITLKKINFDNSVEFLEADWSNIAVNNFTAYITDVFPYIDMEIKFAEGSIKSNYIIKQNLGVKALHFLDQIELSENMDLILSSENPFGMEFAEFYNTSTATTEIVVQPARTFDASESHESWLSSFELSGDILAVICDSIHLNNSNVQYPITVDPTFVAVGPLSNTGGLIGSLVTPASCTNDIVVNYPGGSEPWDAQYAWTVASDFCAQFLIDFGVFVDCWMSEAQIWVESSCGGTSPLGAPATVWTCPGCNNIGTWNPTLPLGSSGNQNMVQCFTPSCTNQSMTFTINLNRTFCVNAYGYDDCVWANSYCQSINDWSVTVQGRSLETLGNTVTGNGTQNIFDADCAGTQNLDPTPLHGVAGYTYLWSTGATSPTITVPGSVSTYSVDVTDACGTTVTALFDIGCPLSNEENFFKAELNDKDEVILSWNKGNLDTDGFFVQQLVDENWQTIALIETQENQFYELLQRQIKSGENTFRLHHLKGEQIIHTIFTTLYKDFDFEIYPNPSAGKFTFMSNQGWQKGLTLQVCTLSGILVEEFIISETQQTIVSEKLEAGCYAIQILDGEQILATKKLLIRPE